MRKVQIFVANSGEMKFDFTGFEGDTCFMAAGKLNELLNGYGIKMDPESMTKKTEEQKVRETNAIEH